MKELIVNLLEWFATNKECISMIVDILGTIATVAAVIVAIVANCKASKSIKYSLRIQEQSKNIDLFEKRVSLIDEIQKEGKTDKMVLELLFQEKNEIVEAYNELQKLISTKNDLEYDLDVYEAVCKNSDGEGGFVSPVDDMKFFESQLEMSGYPEDKVKEFEKLCSDNQITYSETGKPEDAKVYNYLDLSNKIGQINTSIENQKKNLLKLMQTFIQQTITSIK